MKTLKCPRSYENSKKKTKNFKKSKFKDLEKKFNTNCKTKFQKVWLLSSINIPRTFYFTVVFIVRIEINIIVNRVTLHCFFPDVDIYSLNILYCDATLH